MLCRYAGIPARVASGYLVQPANRTADGYGYIVQQKDKHVWTEVFFNGFGWIKFDATEGAQDISDHKVAEKSSVAKNSFLKWLFSSGWLPIVMGIGIFSLIGYLIKTELWDRFRGGKSVSKPQFSLPETNRQIVSTYLEATRKLGRIGLSRSADMTSEEFQKFAASRLQGFPTIVNQFSALTATHAQYRYGSQTATANQVSENSETLKRLVVALKTVPRSAYKAIRANEGVA